MEVVIFHMEKIILGLLDSENGISALVETQSKNRSETSEVCACVGRVGRGWLQEGWHGCSFPGQPGVQLLVMGQILPSTLKKPEPP